MWPGRLKLSAQRAVFRAFPNSCIDLPALLQRFEAVSYVLLKVDTPYKPDDFPKSYPIGKDLDVLVAPQDYEPALEATRLFIHECKWPSEVVVHQNDHRCRFRFMWRGNLHYQIDISHDLYLGGIEQAFLQGRRRMPGGYYVPELRMELLYRGLELAKDPGKRHHSHYIRQHADGWDAEIASSLGIELPSNGPAPKWPLLRKVARRVLRQTQFLVNVIGRIRRGNSLERLTSERYELCVSPEALLSSEYVGKDFSRYDAIVRLMCAERFLRGDTGAFDLYGKMQAARGAVPGYEARFRALLESVSQNGYDPCSSLDVTRDGHLWDGSHRLAIGLYFDVPLMCARMHRRRAGCVDYGLHWFTDNGFSKEECRLIEERRLALFWAKGLFFPVILWPPVAKYFDTIQADIARQFNILRAKEYGYTDEEFETVARAVYAIDDIAAWKVNKKLTFMKNYAKKVRVIWVEFPDPQYRKKALNNAPISIVGEKLKANIRAKYKAAVDNYVYDIVCHTSDNWRHNKSVMDIFGEAGN